MATSNNPRKKIRQAKPTAEVHPLINRHLKERGLTVHDVDVADPNHIAIYNKSLEKVVKS